MNSNVISIAGVVSVLALFFYINYRFKDVIDHSTITAENVRVIQQNNNPNLYDLVRDEVDKTRKIRLEMESQLKYIRELATEMKAVTAEASKGIQKKESPADFLAQFASIKATSPQSTMMEVAGMAVASLPTPIREAVTRSVDAVADAMHVEGDSVIETDDEEDDEIFRSDDDPGNMASSFATDDEADDTHHWR